MSKQIKFYANEERYKHLDPPQPAAKSMPSWYKRASRTFGERPIEPTVKQCVPVFDAMSAGYMVNWPGHIRIWNYGPDDWGWTSNTGIKIENHLDWQIPGSGIPGPVLKLVSPWSYKTPKGYSMWFTAPIWRDSPIVPIDGIVDTDTYNVRVNFPFYFKEQGEWEFGAETPFIQLIPFKRDEFTTKMVWDDTEQESQFKVVTSFIDGYRRKFWQRKSYK